MDDLERDVEEVIVVCEGDLRAAIRALIANRTIEEALLKIEAATSKGYRRKAS